MWTDSHCHLPYPGLEDVEAALVAARAAGVTRMVDVGTDAAQSAAALAVAAAHDGIWATVGLHPHEAVQGVAGIVSLLDRPKVVAVGECGLDYHYDHSPRAVQQEAFSAQVRLALERDLALVVHTREAWDDTWSILRQEGMPSRTVFHCFTGGAREARTCLDLGGYLSFSGIVTFRRADDVREAARLCPLDRLLVETDAPYLAPEPLRGRTNAPANVALVGAEVARVKGVPVERVAGATWANAEQVLRLQQ